MGKIQKLESLCRAMQAERLGRKVLEASLGTGEIVCYNLHGNTVVYIIVVAECCITDCGSL